MARSQILSMVKRGCLWTSSFGRIPLPSWEIHDSHGSCDVYVEELGGAVCEEYWWWGMCRVCCWPSLNKSVLFFDITWFQFKWPRGRYSTFCIRSGRVTYLQKSSCAEERWCCLWVDTLKTGSLIDLLITYALHNILHVFREMGCAG